MEKPSLPKGTRDFGPVVMAKRQFILDSIKKVFQNYGFQPLETPAMENLSTLTGKYGDEGDQLLFKIINSRELNDIFKTTDPNQFIYPEDISQEIKESHQKSDYKIETQRREKLLKAMDRGLRYDLTVPFARYVVMNRGEITFPFKRYQIQPVWRADRPQKGRYREFYQCDADVVGTDSLICEAEIILMIKEVFKSLKISDYSIKVNHRGILSGLAEVAGAKENETALFVAIDKLDKIGEEKVKEELRTKGFDDKSLNAVFEILNKQGSTATKIDLLTNSFVNSEKGKKGIADLSAVLQLLKDYGVSEDHVEFDISLARGLSYYTGCIFEVKINNVAIGSVSGGGRYDNLTQAFGAKEQLSGVGISFGVDRLFDAMEELKLFPEEAQVSSTVLITHFDIESQRYGLGVLQTLRSNNIAAEIYPDSIKIQKQLDYANKKMIPYVIVIGSEEVKSGLLAFKNMKTGTQEKIGIEDILNTVKSADARKQ
jgi:histidyl-tRNA synthetase